MVAGHLRDRVLVPTPLGAVLCRASPIGGCKSPRPALFFLDLHRALLLRLSCLATANFFERDSLLHSFYCFICVCDWFIGLIDTLLPLSFCGFFHTLLPTALFVRFLGGSGPSYFVLRVRSCSRWSPGGIFTQIGANRIGYYSELASMECVEIYKNAPA